MKEKGNMNANSRRVPTRFGPDTRFEVRPLTATPFRVNHESRFEQLKSGLLVERLADLTRPELNSSVRRAANEAAALAWLTPYPLLFFPALFEEKAGLALEQAYRQEDIQARSRELLHI